MAKTATMRKMDMKSTKKSAAKAAPAQKKPQLKVVSKKPAPKAKAAKPAPKKAAAKKPVKLVAVKKAAPKVAAKPQVVKPQAKAAPKAAPAPVKKSHMKLATNKPVAKEAPKKEIAKRDFRVGDHVVYPTHGVGRIASEETQSIGGMSLKMLVISFEKDRMTLRVPVARAASAGLRHVSGNDKMAQVFTTLKSRARASRGMWSRRAQEYETKINSGNIIFIAEVVRDLHPNVDQAERSYSERMIYESALGRLVGELAAAEGTDSKIATDKLMKLLRAKVAA